MWNPSPLPTGQQHTARPEAGAFSESLGRMLRSQPREVRRSSKARSSRHVATSVRKNQWSAAEIHPKPSCVSFTVDAGQADISAPSLSHLPAAGQPPSCGVCQVTRRPSIERDRRGPTSPRSISFHCYRRTASNQRASATREGAGGWAVVDSRSPRCGKSLGFRGKWLGFRPGPARPVWPGRRGC